MVEVVLLTSRGERLYGCEASGWYNRAVIRQKMLSLFACLSQARIRFQVMSTRGTVSDLDLVAISSIPAALPQGLSGLLINDCTSLGNWMLYTYREIFTTLFLETDMNVHKHLIKQSFSDMIHLAAYYC